METSGFYQNSVEFHEKFAQNSLNYTFDVNHVKKETLVSRTGLSRDLKFQEGTQPNSILLRAADQWLQDHAVAFSDCTVVCFALDTIG